MTDERENLPVEDGAEEVKTCKFAVSTNTKIADEFRKLAENVGLNQGELFSVMIDTYRASAAVDGVNKAKEMQDMDRHLKRVQEIFVAIVNELSDCKEESQLTIQTLLQENAEKLCLKNEEIDSLNLDLHTVRAMYQEEKEKNEEQKHLLEEQKAVASEARRTIAMIEKANNRLEEDNEALRGQLDALEHLTGENDELQKQLNDLKKEADLSAAQVEQLKKNIEQQAQEHAEAVEKLKAGHQEEVAKIKDTHRSEIEKIQLVHEKEKFELEKKMAAATDELKVKKDAEIDELKNRIFELETQKNKLVEDLLRLKNESESGK